MCKVLWNRNKWRGLKELFGIFSICKKINNGFICEFIYDNIEQNENGKKEILLNRRLVKYITTK